MYHVCQQLALPFNEKMDTSQLLLLIFTVITASECSETAEPPCEELDGDSYNILEGESFYFVPDVLTSDPDCNSEEITWYKNNSQIKNITTDENENVHTHGGAMFFLNAVTEDSGVYIARYKEPSGECYNSYLEINILEAARWMDSELLYQDIDNDDVAKKVPCPLPVRKTCETFKGNFTWKKDSSPLEEYDEANLRISVATKDDEGIYTCICTWTHNHKEYKSSASRWLKVNDLRVFKKLQIISPTTTKQTADEGVEIKLNCSVFCGINVEPHCEASWHVNNIPVHHIEGYSQITETVTLNSSQNTISTAILTIEKVSAEDFESEFKCIYEGLYEKLSATLTLKRRESIIPLVIGGVCVLFFFVFAAVLVKCFAIDLALFFRPYFPLSSYKKDARVYDAYVVYQTQSLDKVTEETLCQFITNTLPHVLEEKCGYRLFIHGRDDIPGEDRLEQVEDRMKQSRRLMVLLTPRSGSESESSDQYPASCQNSVIGGFDWQVGLHHALLQREMSVILIQLGDTGPQGYTHLPAGLQHLIRKSAPIRWLEGSRGAAAWNSRFWKRVRYLMPAKPAKKCSQSAII